VELIEQAIADQERRGYLIQSPGKSDQPGLWMENAQGFLKMVSDQIEDAKKAEAKGAPLDAWEEE